LQTSVYFEVLFLGLKVVIKHCIMW